MRGSAARALLALAAVTASLSVSAFVTLAPEAGATRRGAPLRLLPNQGRQLVAASCASLARKREKREDSPSAATTAAAAPPADPPPIEVSGLPSETPLSVAVSTGAAREFAGRILSLPSALRRRGSAPSRADGGEISPLSFGGGDGDGDGEVVLYPILGFRWVKGEDGKCRVLPPAACAVGCSIQMRDQEVYGWYSHACPLGSLYGLDDEYCSHPPLAP